MTTKVLLTAHGSRFMRTSAAAGLIAVLGVFGAAPAYALTELTFASTLPGVNPMIQQVMAPWVEEFNAAGEGIIKINLKNGPALASHANVYERVNSGIIDMGWGILGSVGAPFPRTSVSALPFLVEKSSSGSTALWNIYKQGLLDDDFKNVNMVSLLALPVAGLHANKPITSRKDIAGMKFRTADKISSDLMTALGASAVSIPTVEAYQALEQGVIDGAFTGWTGLVFFKLDEVTTNHLEINLASGPAGIFINKAVYEGLSPEAKKIVDEAGPKFVARISGWFDKVTGIFAKKVMAGGGHTTHELSNEERQAWVALAQPILADWVKNTPNGENILAAFKAELVKTSK